MNELYYILNNPILYSKRIKMFHNSNMYLLSVKNSPKPDKKMVATFCLCEKKNECKGSNHKEVHFGSKGSKTYLDHKDKQKKDAYIARHKVNEDWTKPTSAGALSKYLLWNLPTLSQSIAYFKKKFKV